MDFQTFKTQFERQPLGKQFDQLRRAGFSAVDPDQAALVRHAAARVGLLPTATPLEVLYARQYSAVGCPSCDGSCNQPVNGPDAPPTLKSGCVAENFPLQLIYTDPARFQNRTDAFSELSAEAVAKHYDPNKFDPLVVWPDPKAGKVFVLSGHSRLEGMRRRGAAYVPVRKFAGTEAEAIQFARVDANRGGTAENLVEDLKAYRLMRDGDQARQLKPAKRGELSRAFKGKAARLEAWSQLDPAGSFLQALQLESRSEFPYLEKLATWTGQLRAAHSEMTNTHERDVFNWLYSEKKNGAISRDDFDQLITNRLAWGKARLFPECGPEGCADLNDLAKRGAHAKAYKELELLATLRETLNKRLRTADRGLRIYTDQERAVVRDQLQLVDDEVKRLRRDLGKAEEAPGLFGLGDLPPLPTKRGQVLELQVGDHHVTIRYRPARKK